MNKIYMIALALVTGMNILYTVWSFNMLNTWKEEHELNHESAQKIVNDQSKYKKIFEGLIENDERFNSTDRRIIEAVMGLESRIYSLEDVTYETNNKKMQ